MIERRFVELIANEISVKFEQVSKAIELFNSGATIPFVARYRKDTTGNLDEVQLEQVHDRNNYFVSFQNRRKSILENIDKQGKLTDELKQQIEVCSDKVTMEDLYRPFKKKQRTKATIAREQGLEPLADFIWKQEPSDTTIEDFALTFVNTIKGIEKPEKAIEGARFIVAERIAEDAGLRETVRGHMLKTGKLVAHSTKNVEGKSTKYESYYDYSEPLSKVPSHRFLAVTRGNKAGYLRAELAMDDSKLLPILLAYFIKDYESEFAPHIKHAFIDAYRRLLLPSIENEVFDICREQAGSEAIRVFRENARNLLMSSPAGGRVIMGVDPALRTGCKLAVVDATGAFLENAVIFPNPPHNKVEEAEELLKGLIEKYNVEAIAIGNGTGSRETSKFINSVIGKLSESKIFSVLVNEAGASIYSASKIAREELPDLDVTVRGAVSIARRLQDPLAEFVKIDPRHVGVGQYQHDVNQKQLREGLTMTVVSCVNTVGVDLNTASLSLLKYISGIQANTSENIIAYRTEKGGFTSRDQLKEVPGIGPKVFEQSAGFLRINGAENPLDSTAVHPEAYSTVEEMAKNAEMTVRDLIGNKEALKNIELLKFESVNIGEYTLKDISAELFRPGRDPRSEFKVPKFLEGVESLDDVTEGMEMEGVVTNVTDFGAFIDVGVEQDGLVHLSELATQYIHDPREIVKVGDIVKVKVLKIDRETSRISLSMKALVPARNRRKKSRHSSSSSKEKQAKDESRGRKTDPRKSGSASEQKNKKKRNTRKPARSSKGRNKAVEHIEHEERLNTSLADQLAGLRDKFEVTS